MSKFQQEYLQRKAELIAEIHVMEYGIEYFTKRNLKTHHFQTCKSNRTDDLKELEKFYKANKDRELAREAALKKLTPKERSLLFDEVE